MDAQKEVVVEKVAASVASLTENFQGEMLDAVIARSREIVAEKRAEMDTDEFRLAEVIDARRQKGLTVLCSETLKDLRVGDTGFSWGKSLYEIADEGGTIALHSLLTCGTGPINGRDVCYAVAYCLDHPELSWEQVKDRFEEEREHSYRGA